MNVRICSGVHGPVRIVSFPEICADPSSCRCSTVTTPGPRLFWEKPRTLFAPPAKKRFCGFTIWMPDPSTCPKRALPTHPARTRAANTVRQARSQ